MGLAKEFRNFVMRGNVLDLAIGVIIGAAFGRIVNSLVEDILMPPMGKIIGNMDFTNLYLPLYKLPAGTGEYPKTLADAKKLGSVVAYGNFLTISITFAIIAFCIFLLVKLINVAEKHFHEENKNASPPPATKEELLLTEIRDLLKANASR
jgi:large conductance mechanosensitive channel